MIGDSYARAELEHEGWSERLERVTQDTRELIAATREVITRSQEALAQADERLKHLP